MWGYDQVFLGELGQKEVSGELTGGCSCRSSCLWELIKVSTSFLTLKLSRILHTPSSWVIEVLVSDVASGRIFTQGILNLFSPLFPIIFILGDATGAAAAGGQRQRIARA